MQIKITVTKHCIISILVCIKEKCEKKKTDLTIATQAQIKSQLLGRAESSTTLLGIFRVLAYDLLRFLALLQLMLT